jgi:HPt (histidine-containing phosphotransfer) domain-containing protein
MNDLPVEFPGLDRIRVRFLSLLEERQIQIAQSALAALESDSAAGQCLNLEVAQAVLHQISGTAGSLGYAELGQAARECEGAIINYIESTQNRHFDLPYSILEDLDAFLSKSQALLAQAK